MTKEQTQKVKGGDGQMCSCGGKWELAYGYGGSVPGGCTFCVPLD